MRLGSKAWSQLTAVDSDAKVMESQMKFIAEREMRAVGESAADFGGLWAKWQG